MSEFFNHVPQTSNATNQVGNIAAEIDQAFLAVEDIIDQGEEVSTSIASSIGSLDNWYIKEYLPGENTLIDNYVQNLVFAENSQEASLDLFPATDGSNLTAIHITNITDSGQNYTYASGASVLGQNEYTIVGRKLVLGGPPFNPSNQSETYQLQITYNGYNTTDSQSPAIDLRYNILKSIDGSNTIEFPFTTSGTTYTVSGYNFRDLCSPAILEIIDTSPEEAIRYSGVFGINGDQSLTRISCSSITITTNSFVFVTDDDLSSFINVKLYVSNASLGKLLESLYRLFYVHNHGNNGGELVNHSDLTGLFTNTYDPTSGDPKIEYHVSRKQNYDHPQYLNREGYIDDEAVYNNAMLGDLLVASTDPTDRNNNIIADSNALAFGSMSNGPSLYYDIGEISLVLDAHHNNGFKIKVSQTTDTESHKAFSINEHVYSDVHDLDGVDLLQLALMSTTLTDETTNLPLTRGVFKLYRKDPILGDVDEARIYVHDIETTYIHINAGGDINIANTAQLSFGDDRSILIKKLDNGLHFSENIPSGSTSLGLSKVYFDMNIVVDEAEITDLNATNVILKDGIVDPETSDITNQRIVYGTKDPVNGYTQHINYDGTNLNINTDKFANVASTGIDGGLSIANKFFTFICANDGGKVSSTGASTDTYFANTANSGKFVFLQTNPSDPSYVPGSTDLSEVTKGIIVADSTEVSTVKITNQSANGGVLLSNTNNIFASMDESRQDSIILKSPGYIVAANTYTANTDNSIITVGYGKFKASRYEAVGEISGTGADAITDPSSGFFGNMTVNQSQRLTVNSPPTFTTPVQFIAGIKDTSITDSPTISATNIIVDNLSVNSTLTVDALVTGNGSNPGNISLTSGRIFQQESDVQNTFMGEVIVYNDLEVRDNHILNMHDSKIVGVSNSASPADDEAVAYRLLNTAIVPVASGLAAETAARIAGDGGLDTRVTVLESRAQATNYSGSNVLFSSVINGPLGSTVTVPLDATYVVIAITAPGGNGGDLLTGGSYSGPSGGGGAGATLILKCTGDVGGMVIEYTCPYTHAGTPGFGGARVKSDVNIIEMNHRSLGGICYALVEQGGTGMQGQYDNSGHGGNGAPGLGGLGGAASVYCGAMPNVVVTSSITNGAEGGAAYGIVYNRPRSGNGGNGGGQAIGADIFGPGNPNEYGKGGIGGSWAVGAATVGNPGFISIRCS